MDDPLMHLILCLLPVAGILASFNMITRFFRWIKRNFYNYKRVKYDNLRLKILNISMDLENRIAAYYAKYAEGQVAAKKRNLVNNILSHKSYKIYYDKSYGKYLCRTVPYNGEDFPILTGNEEKMKKLLTQEYDKLNAEANNTFSEAAKMEKEIHEIERKRNGLLLLRDRKRVANDIKVFCDTFMPRTTNEGILGSYIDKYNYRCVINGCISAEKAIADAKTVRK